MKLLMSIVYISALGILSHYIGESLPRRWFREDRFPYKSIKWERNGKIYDKIRIRKWKARLPDMSRILRDMLPKRVTYDATSLSVQALIKETCVAEFIHKLLCLFSTGVFFIWKDIIGIILSAVCIIVNIPFILIQRYNRPHLITLKNKLTAREERRKKCVC